MSKRWRLLIMFLAGVQLVQVGLSSNKLTAVTRALADASTPGMSVPTVVIPTARAVTIPTVTIPTAPIKRKAAKKRLVQKRRAVRMRGQQIWAFLTNYCPSSAGSMASSGSPVFYGMLANDYYPFGTRVFLPPLGMTGIVEDRTGGFGTWNHFDVWSPVCYSTPTGWFKVVVRTTR